MYLLATSFQRKDYYIVDNIWNPDEFYTNQNLKRVKRHSLRVDIIDMVEKDDYDICIFKTFWLSIFQRKVRRLLFRDL
jgi:hypothetical protein